ncbi:MAG: LegC family aminotransferase [Blastochloris sp.]|nr:LegC family aminotransferase [Blastochloris sp.]
MSSEAAFIPLSVPDLQGREWELIKDCLDTGWVSSVGAYVDRFEKSLAEQAGTSYAVATSSGTAALHVALLVAGVKPGDLVLVPSMTFIAPVNAITYVGAVPVFMDAEPRHWQMDVGLMEIFLTEECVFRADGLFHKDSGARVAALLPVHVLGHPVDMEHLMKLARTFEIPVIEDATESLGSLYHGKPTGGLGHVGCFSFNGNKIITTGGGGMLVTENADWAKRAKYLTTQAKDDPVEYIHGEIGYNYRLTNLQAAMGCAQMERLARMVAQRRQIRERYFNSLRELPGLTFQEEAPNVTSNFWLSTLLVDEKKCSISARALRQKLSAERIDSRPLWQPIHQSPAYRRSGWVGAAACPVAERLFDQALSLPSTSSLSEKDVDRVLRAIRYALEV